MLFSLLYAVCIYISFISLSSVHLRDSLKCYDRAGATRVLFQERMKTSYERGCHEFSSLSGAIILMLEKKSAELAWDPTWVFMTMLEIGIPFPVLHGIYDRLFKAKVRKTAVREDFNIVRSSIRSS